MDMDIRWRQRLDSYQRSLATLNYIYDTVGDRPLNLIERQALIKSFELCYETGWNLMKDWFEYQGLSGITGSRDAVRQAFTAGLVTQGDIWMDMIRNRNRTAHIYNESVAKEVETLITTTYRAAFMDFAETMVTKANNAD